MCTHAYGRVPKYTHAQAWQSFMLIQRNDLRSYKQYNNLRSYKQYDVGNKIRQCIYASKCIAGSISNEKRTAIARIGTKISIVNLNGIQTDRFSVVLRFGDRQQV